MFKVRDKSIAIFPSPEAYLEKNIYDEPFLRYIDDKTLDASGQILEENIFYIVILKTYKVAVLSAPWKKHWQRNICF